MIEEEETDSQEDVEPLLAALQDGSREAGSKGRGAGRSSLGWKLLWAALVLIALLAIVLNQAF
jgi:hypothetical protein